MKRSIVTIWVFSTLTAAVVASAGPGDFDPGYPTGSVRLHPDFQDMFLLDDERLLISEPASIPFITLSPVVFVLRSDGYADLSVGDAGRLVLSVPAGRTWSRLAAVAPDGKLLVSTVASGHNEILRLNPDGKLDPHFGVGGQLALEEKAAVEFVRDGYQAAGVNVTPDGRVQVFQYPMDCFDFWEVGCTPLLKPVIVRQFMPDGTPDESYGTRGQAEFPAYTGAPVQAGVRLTDGKLVQAMLSGDGRQLEVLRLLPDGRPDPDFGGGTGRSAIDHGLRLEGGIRPTDARVSQVIATGDGRYLYMGLSLERYIENVSHLGAFALLRLTGNGELDRTFGRNGLSPMPISASGPNPFLLDRADRPLVLAHGQIIRLLPDESPSPGLLEARSPMPGQVPESSGTVQVLVSRFAGRSGAISARVVALSSPLPGENPAIAIEGQDYVLRTTRLDWADGDETDKPISVDILDDKDPETSEYVKLQILEVTNGIRVFYPFAGTGVSVGIDESDSLRSTDSATSRGLDGNSEAGGGALAPEWLLLLVVWIAMRGWRRQRVSCRASVTAGSSARPPA